MRWDWSWFTVAWVSILALMAGASVGPVVSKWLMLLLH